MSNLVTGGAGFVGGHLVQAIVEDGGVAIVVDNLYDNYDWILKREAVESNFAKSASILEGTGERPILVCHAGDSDGICPRCAMINAPMATKLTASQWIASSSSTASSSPSENAGAANREKMHLRSTGLPAAGMMEFHHVAFHHQMSDCECVFQVHAPFNTVYHLGGLGGVRESVRTPGLYVQVNVGGSVNMLELSAKYKVPHVVLASSSSVYGEGSVAPFKESERCDAPVSPYAASKRAMELFGHAYSQVYDMKITACRFFTVYGPRCRPDMATFKFVEGVLNEKAIPVFGDGSAKRAYTFVSDIVDGLMKFGEMPAKSFRIVNLGGGSEYRLDELIGSIEKFVGKKAIIDRLPDQAGDVRLTSADQTFANSEIGFTPKVGLDEGVRRTVEWYKEFAAWVETQATKELPEPPIKIGDTNGVSIPLSNATVL